MVAEITARVGLLALIALVAAFCAISRRKSHRPTRRSALVTRLLLSTPLLLVAFFVVHQFGSANGAMVSSLSAAFFGLYVALWLAGCAYLIARIIGRNGS